MLGTPKEARWVRPTPRRDVDRSVVDTMIRRAFPSATIANIESLDGLRNANFKVFVDSRAVVLRIYEHDRSLCRKELDLLNLIGSRVPVPQVLYAEPDASRPFAILDFVEGCTFQHVKRTCSTEEIGQAAYAVGQTLAALGTVTFPRSGWIGPGASVTRPLLEGPDPEARFVDLCLESENLRHHMDHALIEIVHAMAWRHAEAFRAHSGERRLVHGDFGKRNMLMRKAAERWTVAALIDWEFAVSASPLIDVGHFLRYERAARPRLEPHFSQGFVDGGGRLPRNWRSIARALDAMALCESLTHADLPPAFALEIIELIRATAEDRDPVLA
jgi:aminoglycoside phosphotransferase (APT) family kinase protein